MSRVLLSREVSRSVSRTPASLTDDDVLVFPAVPEPVPPEPPDPPLELVPTPPVPPEAELLLELLAPPLDPPSDLDELLPPLLAEPVVVLPPETLRDELLLPPLPPLLELEEPLDPALLLVLLGAEATSSEQALVPRLAKAKSAETNDMPNFEFMNDSLELSNGIPIR